MSSQGNSEVMVHSAPRVLSPAFATPCSSRSIASPSLWSTSLSTESHRTCPRGHRRQSGFVIAALDSPDSGKLVFALSKERLSRRKHDGGDVTALVHHVLDAVSAKPEDVKLVVANNHHFPILPFEEKLPFSVAMGYCPPDYRSKPNLIGSGTHKVELSHHLAHAYSGIHNAPFDTALVVVMDGMGDKRSEWGRSEEYTGEYIHEHGLPTHDAFREYPSSEPGQSFGKPGVSYREAETAYLVSKQSGGSVSMARVFKRWTPEVSPPELYNHGFHDMESIGAVYSRVASHIFGDWNVCGKVMGLAPWGSTDSDIPRLIEGRIFDGSVAVVSDVLAGLPHAGVWGAPDSTTPQQQQFCRDLAARVQDDSERVLLAFLSDLQAATGAENLIVTGGVALNSTLNGRIMRESPFKQVYIPCMPGDEGIAIGCALYGYTHQYAVLDGAFASLQSLQTRDEHQQRGVLPRPPRFEPYLGTRYSAQSVRDACAEFAAWVECDDHDGDTSQTIATVVQGLVDGQVVGWFCGRSEFGARALGGRSLVADPRRADMVQRLNAVVKRRESFRPFAPTCLAEHAHELFGDAIRASSSPYMSLTHALLRPDATPAVAHVDGTARLQTLTRTPHTAAYHDMISTFHAASGVPAVLNTSFNVAGEPIVESPADAIRTLLEADGIGMLAFPDAGIVLRPRTRPDATGGDARTLTLRCPSFRSEVARTSLGDVARVALHYREPLGHVAAHADAGDGAPEVCRERCAALDSADELELLELVASYGADGATISDVLASVAAGVLDNECVHADDLDAAQARDVRALVDGLWRKLLLRVAAMPPARGS